MRVYVAGPMRGVRDFNFPLFFYVADCLREAGHEPINPALQDGETCEAALDLIQRQGVQPFRHYMRHDLYDICDRAEALCLLPGWQDSVGARLEVHVARSIGVPLMRWDGEALVPRVEVVGLAGVARSGKDTAGRFFADYGQYRRVAFADGVREALQRLDPLLDVHSIEYSGPLRYNAALASVGYDWLKANTDARDLLQRMGTEVGREMFGENVWVDRLFDALPDGDRVVVTDVRFPNEVDAVLAAGGRVFRVVRPGVEAANGHVSESALDDLDLPVLLNDGSVFDLRERVRALL